MSSCMPKHLGARNELIATTWLLNQGYEVFRNVSQSGEIDIIAMKDGNLSLFDVKTIEKTGSPADRLSASQVAKGIKRLNVCADLSCEIIESPRVSGQDENRDCPVCGFSFVSSRRALYCSKTCVSRAYRQRRETRDAVTA